MEQEDIPDIDYQDKVEGMLSGVALGDALGAPHEFRQSIPLTQYTGHLDYQVRIPSRFQGMRYGVIGQVTDDTEMTLALANALVEKGRYDRNSVIRTYQDWANSKPVGMGRNTRRLFAGVKTVKGYQQRYDKALAEDLVTTQSNGSLMRATPLALLVNPDDPNTFGSVIDDVNLSNPNEVNQEASLIYVMLVAVALRTNPESQDENDLLSLVTDDLDSLSPLVREAIVNAIEGSPRDVTLNKGWVLHGLYTALMGIRYYYQALHDGHDQPLREALNGVVLLGGDTDTNAAIAGGLLGALVGYKRLLQQEADNIFILDQAITEEGDFPRPYMYHPKTIQEIAEELVRLFPL